MSNNTYRAALALSMQDAMAYSSNTIIIGQGVTDFKGIFGTTSGLSSRYPARVIETPLAEDSIAGICIGAALNGLYPINTHIRADFGLLIFNQLINLAAKYRYMFGGLFRVPMLIRLIIGRSWGQGAQHSQSLQSLLGHIPGLRVVMPSSPAAILACYKEAVQQYRGPVVSFEHRLMYDLNFDEEPQGSPGLTGSRLIIQGSDITLVATSVMVLEAKRAAQYLIEHGVSVELIDLHSISHPDHALIVSSIAKTRRLLVVDTSWQSYGVASEINRIINETDPSLLTCKTVSLGMKPAPCPTAKVLEDLYYPDVHDIVKAVLSQVEPIIGGIKLPKKESMTDFYKHFKGPF
jgi:pyruvate dehydrogenase E1 component beta subunit